jgi:hypothetical protein
MWPEHGDTHNWALVHRRARLEALFLADRYADPYATVPAEWMADVCAREADLRAYLDLVCETMSDYDFSRLMRH